MEVFDDGEGALRFTFHTPFTVAGKVHGSTADQCKKLTELEVRNKVGQDRTRGAAPPGQALDAFVSLLFFFLSLLFGGDGRNTPRRA